MLQNSKRIVFFLLLMVLLLSGIYITMEYGGQIVRSNAQRPNIIVIMADDLGWNDVSFHGANQIPTPNIDALAYNGVILQRHYVLPTCTPSRTAFLTGRYPIRTGMQGYPMKAGEPRGIPLKNTLLPEHLRKLGYATHLIGKWHVGYYTKKHTPVFRGFDTFFGYYNGYVQYFNHTITQDNYTGHDLHRDASRKLSVEYSSDYLTDVITEEAEKIISVHDKAKPLYLQVTHLAPHSSDAEDPMEVRDMKEINSTLNCIEDTNRRKFGGMVTALDQSVGRIVKSLNQAKLLENSIILFLTDNGAQTEGLLENYGSNYPLRGLKFTLFEGGVRGVACVYSPLIKKSSRISQHLIHITDWLPTFYSAAGGNPEDLGSLDGVDQWNVIKNAKRGERGSVLLNIDEVSGNEAAMIGRYKLVKRAGNLYGSYYGDNSNNEACPVYEPTGVLSSPAGEAIASLSRSFLTSKRIKDMRDESAVTCESFLSFPNCSSQCLFDVFEDPCESTDLSVEYREIVDELNAFLNRYRTALMKQTNADVDPGSVPKSSNDTWMPWREKERLF